jgi:hypothetical protein
MMWTYPYRSEVRAFIHSSASLYIILKDTCLAYTNIDTTSSHILAARLIANVKRCGIYVTHNDINPVLAFSGISVIPRELYILKNIQFNRAFVFYFCFLFFLFIFN